MRYAVCGMRYAVCIQHTTKRFPKTRQKYAVCILHIAYICYSHLHARHFRQQEYILAEPGQQRHRAILSDPWEMLRPLFRNSRQSVLISVLLFALLQVLRAVDTTTAKKMSKSNTPPSVNPTRSQLMARIRSKNTAPEKRVRRVLFAMGYRFRIHRRELPGCPDIVFISRRKAIFVNGCFWHQHPGCPRAKLPVTNQDYWLPKLERNKQRDEKAVKQLAQRDWKVLTIWGCEMKDETQLRKILKGFLGSPRHTRPRKGLRTVA
jgi:DNA mismatch endonuclease (patch repair protein)